MAGASAQPLVRTRHATGNVAARDRVRVTKPGHPSGSADVVDCDGGCLHGMLFCHTWLPACSLAMEGLEFLSSVAGAPTLTSEEYRRWTRRGANWTRTANGRACAANPPPCARLKPSGRAHADTDYGSTGQHGHVNCGGERVDERSSAARSAAVQSPSRSECERSAAREPAPGAHCVRRRLTAEAAEAMLGRPHSRQSATRSRGMPTTGKPPWARQPEGCPQPGTAPAGQRTVAHSVSDSACAYSGRRPRQQGLLCVASSGLSAARRRRRGKLRGQGMLC